MLEMKQKCFVLNNNLDYSRDFGYKPMWNLKTLLLFDVFHFNSNCASSI